MPSTSRGNTADAHRWKLLLPHRERLRGLVRRRLANPQDAEDCVQETILRAASFTDLDEARVGPFLTSTALRLCVDYYRTAERQHRLRQRVAVIEKPLCPEEIVCERELGLWMLDQARRLRGRERQVMLARAEGMSITQAADHLRISVKAAESAFTRGRARLRAIHDRAMSEPAAEVTPRFSEDQAA
jgi:RNA polymerase sigma factor (sigma-70 family)